MKVCMEHKKLLRRTNNTANSMVYVFMLHTSVNNLITFPVCIYE